MMDQFQIKYIPGGMTLNHSGFFLCLVLYFNDGVYIEQLKKVGKADYQ